ncbi:flagellar export chaperone FliS [Effusibacillus lacus]|uniref:Flagellar protein FliS n=1 Tax=Effusibacillus lacus TaxID=1348429 RepID=A0A292YKJ9_9BACL|nr:flagellar export chaperone FliS [Effusibacillus lacus]TCS69822.1 flagellar protein FliS [Effusibacillus lacus]GAX88904.1 flagellar protein FliS [Effusibacillus lacus]
MSMANPYQQYKRVQIETARPQELILMLYDEAIKQLKLVMESIDQKKMEATNNSFKKVQDILEELLASINPEAGEIAVQLQSLYNFMIRHAAQANIEKSKRKAQDVLDLFISLRTTWAQAMKEANA